MDGEPTLVLGGATGAINVSVLQLQNQRWGTSPRFTESLYFDDLLVEAREDTTCYADCDGDGVLDFGDFLCYQTLFATADPQADCDGSGQFDFFDLLCFQNEFAAGCP